MYEQIDKRLERIEKLIAENKQKDKEILNLDEASKYLNLAKSYLYKKTANKSIPHYKSGKKLVFKKDELDQWLLRDKKAVEDLDKQASDYLINNPKTF